MVKYNLFSLLKVALPENQPRVFHGPITPCTLLHLVSKGIDIYDATFPWVVAERNGALIFPHSMSSNGYFTYFLQLISIITILFLFLD